MKLIPNLAAASIGVILLSSCTMFNDDLAPCQPEPVPEPEPTPVTELTFTYTYNMDYKDLFDRDAHCLDVFVFDESGKKVFSKAITDISKGSTVPVELEDGKYTVVTFGGTACEDASFEKLFTDDDNLKLSDLKVAMKSSYYYVADGNTDAPGVLYQELTEDEHQSLELHRLFYGKKEITVNNKAGRAGNAVMEIPLQRNTNRIEVTVENSNGVVKKEDYHIMIKDDNDTFNWDNSIQKTGDIYYRPYVKDDNTEDNQLTAKFTISRMVASNNPKLVLANPDGTRIMPDLDLRTKVLEKNDTKLPEQEYLDRENSWGILVKIGPSGEIDIEIKDWDVNDNPFYDYE